MDVNMMKITFTNPVFKTYMFGSLDCMHVPWKNCPVAWQGSHSGKEGYPTLVLEAMADHNLFFWHASFGWAGTLNDLNIWEGSNLHASFLDGTWSESVDFTFQINGQHFSKLFVLVDGIYPELSRFVKTLGEAVGHKDKAYASWQEAARKDIERAFGVLQRKFQILVKKMEYHKKEHIKDIVLTCIIMHNMMVDYRMSRDEEENESWYAPSLETNDDGVVVFDQDRDELDRARADIRESSAIQSAFYRGSAVDFAGMQQQQNDLLLEYEMLLVQKRWEKLHDKSDFRRLRDAIMEQVCRNTEVMFTAEPIFKLHCI
jgi:Plant transposon protein